MEVVTLFGRKVQKVYNYSIESMQKCIYLLLNRVVCVAFKFLLIGKVLGVWKCIKTRESCKLLIYNIVMLGRWHEYKQSCVRN